MQGQDKGWVLLAGQPMVAHVLARLRPQVDTLLINANRNPERYAGLGCQVVADHHTGFQGPLAGMEALLTAIAATPSAVADSARDLPSYAPPGAQPEATAGATGAPGPPIHGVVTCPCDAPFLPMDLVDRLTAHIATDGPNVGAVAVAGGRLQPVFAYLPVTALPSLRAALADGERKIDRWFAQEHFREVAFEDTDAFQNLNTPEDVARHAAAADMLGTATPTPVRCTSFGAPVIGVSAPSGTGKTTFLCALLPRLRAAGLRVGVVKRAHHTVDVDTPGKDSYEIRHAGSERVLLASRNRWALMVETPDHAPASVAELVARIESPALDLVLIEGFDLGGQPRVVLHRDGVGDPVEKIAIDSEVLAVFSDKFSSEPCEPAAAFDNSTQGGIRPPVIHLDLNDISAASVFFLNLVQQFRHGNLSS